MGKAMHKLREMLCEELDKLSRSGDLTPSKLDLVDKLTHSIKSIDTIMAMEEYEEEDEEYSFGGGYSNARGRGRNARRDSMGRYSREGQSYAGGGSGGGGSSNYSGARNSYARRGGYSRDDGSKEEVMQKLQELMNETSDSNVRMAIQNALSEM